MTKNQVENKALIANLKLSIEMEAKVINIISDSQLMVRQISEAYETRFLVWCKEGTIVKFWLWITWVKINSKSKKWLGKCVI